MSLCEKTKELLVLFAEDELMPDEKSMVEAHLEECDSCRAELAKYKSIMKNLAMEEYALPASYSSELIVNINEKLDKQRARKLKLAPAISFASILLVFAISLLFRNDVSKSNKVFTEEYLIYKQYSATSFFEDADILEESEEIASALMPSDYISSSQEYLLENSVTIKEATAEVFDQMDDESFDEFINNLKNMEI